MKFKAHKRWMLTPGGRVTGYQAVFIKDNGSQLMTADGKRPIVVTLKVERIAGGYNERRIRVLLMKRMRKAIEKVSEEHGKREATHRRPEDERR